MPLTPFHLGPGLLIGLLLFSWLHLPTFLLANMLPDLEPLAALTVCADCELHGFWHSLAGASILAAVLSIGVILARKPIEKLSELFRVKQEVFWKNVLPAAFLGTFLHVLLDSTLYPEMKPLYPLELNPFYIGSTAFAPVYVLCTILFVAGLVLYAFKARKITAQEKPLLIS